MLGVFAWLAAGCSSTKHLPAGAYLLRKNALELKSDQGFTRKGELTDQVNALIIQKPNTYVLGLPYKIWLYNLRYRHYNKDTSSENFQIKHKTVERPVIFDSLLQRRSAINIKSFLFNRGYFYATVVDTIKIKGKKVKAIYSVNTGTKYLVGDVRLEVKDSLIHKLITDGMTNTFLKPGVPFSMTMTEEERSRIANLLRNKGYYKITQENVHFVIDTVNKSFLRDAENPFESAINFIALQRKDKNPTLDITLSVTPEDDSNSFRRYRIGKVQIFPDFIDRSDIRDSTMTRIMLDSVNFRYHSVYVRPRVLLSQNYMKAGDYYSQANYDLTVTKMNELGLFQYVRPVIFEDTSLPPDQSLHYILILNPTKKYDYGTNFEVSTGSNYRLGNNVSINFRNRNWLHGGNQLTLSLSAGVEMGYNDGLSNNVLKNFYIISKNAGISSTVTFPKFIVPFKPAWLRRFNQPRTILGIGYNLLDRLEYFTLNNIIANYTYSWNQNSTITWDVTPAAVNILSLPYIADSFQKRLANNDYLKNSYRENFIEGESIGFTFSDLNSAHASRGYSYLKANVEEAGALLSGINSIKKIGFNYSQYVKFDLDARHYFRRPNSTLALRFLGGVGVPYDKSSTLPYVKQYFVGGAYSIRGWRVRQLGPGSYYDPKADTTSNPIDRIGDIKLEANVEYRFNMIQLFSGAIHLNGAFFIDAGNIWLARPSDSYPGGEFAFNKLGQDIAMSGGAGLRADIGGLFIIRVDGAFPLKKPYIHENSGWILREVSQLDKSLGNGNWRSRNVVLNIAIGYPF